MRAMLLFRGAPGCGKSTKIKELGLENYALSADNIRLLIQSPAMTVDGSYTIAMNDEKTVWSILFDALEARMKRGEFVVIDATNSKTADMQKYKQLSDTYRYRMYLIDMTNIPMEECKRRNANRLPEYKRVPEHVIENQYARFASQQIPSGIKVLDDNEDYIKQMSFDKIDFSHYRKIHHIGDIHGCYTVLKKYMDENYNEEDLFIFTGDYIDRGIENKEVLEYIFKCSSNRENFIFLEGNHEVHLRNWANDMYDELSKGFRETLPQIEGGKVSKKDARKFCRNLRQFAYYTYGNKVVMVTHGGIPRILENTLFMPTVDMIRGVGAYEDALTVDLAFETNMPENYYQIHGHRNIEDLPIKATDRCFNLEGQVEIGGHLRVVTLDKNGFETHEIQNEVFSTQTAAEADNFEVISEEMMFNLMQDNSLVAEKKSKKYPNISAFNFKPMVFKGRLWDTQTVKARGLFFNNETKKIVMRSYEKFFNINERENTKLHNLKRSMQFPVYEYLKYNGFLGLQSVHNGELIYSSKSSLESEHAEWFKEIFENSVSKEAINALIKSMEDLNYTLVYEVIDPVNDPHIIKYDKPFVVLIAAVYNTVEFEQVDYEELCRIANLLGVKVKERTAVINTWQDFLARYDETNKEDFTHNGEPIEGFVYEGANGFMTKSKLFYYNQWKLLRGVAQSQIRHNHIRFSGALTTPESNLFYGWLRKQPRERVLGKDIISLRDMFEEDNL